MVDYQTLCKSMIVGQVLPCTQVEATLLAALENLPRHEAVASACKNLAYADKDMPLEEGRFLMAAMPFVRLVRMAGIERGESVLDVGCGLGYTSLLLHALTPHVVGIEKSEALIDRAQTFCKAHGDGRSPLRLLAREDPLGGAPEEGPFDVIVVEGALKEVPQALLGQLKEGGRLVCFVQGEKGSLPRATLVTKYTQTFSKACIFEASVSCLTFNAPGDLNHAAA